MTRPESPVSAADLAALGALDTPTVCNALELVDAKFRLAGYTREPLFCAYPDLKPIVGFARTATIRAAVAPADPKEAVKARRLAWYEYVAHGGPLPSIAVIEDQDGPLAGLGAFWGEVNTHIHRGLGARGVVTNGSVRDLDANATGFQLLASRVTPSHAHVHVTGFGARVKVAGLEIASGDLVHADRHGAAVIPVDLVRRVLDAAALLQRREGVILAAARAEGFDFAQLARAIRDADEIH
jgi:regulator of RNase E activity RraA